MRCNICDDDILDNEDYAYCCNCGNEFHVKCIDTTKPCPICESIDTLGIICV